MINKKSLDVVDRSIFSKNFVKPLYDSYCFSNIPQTIINILSNENQNGLPDDVFGPLPKKYDKVIFFLVDAFGWRFFEKYQSHPFLRKIIRQGVVSKITSMFPSTTAAHITTIHTGLPLTKSAILEWYYYEPKLDSIFAPIPFTYARQRKMKKLLASGLNPRKIYPNQSFYNILKKHSIYSYAIKYEEYINSIYSRFAIRGARAVPFQTISKGLDDLIKLVLTEKRKAYYFVYFDRLDSIGHHFGPESKQLEAEIDVFLSLLDRRFYQNIKGKAKNTLLIITADHGLTAIDPKKTVYLNRKFRRLKKYLRTSKKGELLAPAGSCRDMFLYIKDEYLDEAYVYLQEGLIKTAQVFKTQYLIDQGFFGSGKPSRLFMKRAGNLTILPYENESVWWYEKGVFEVKHLGHHGGLSRNEMEIPFLIYSF